MSFSPALKWFIVIFLSLTLTWKVIVGVPSDGHLEDDIIAFLTREGFDAVAAQDTNSRRILAVSSSCRMRVIITSNDGSDRDMLRSLISADESLIFVYQGKVYQEQPILLTVSAGLWTRALRMIGLRDHHDSVLAVLARHKCDVGRMPWDQLQ